MSGAVDFYSQMLSQIEALHLGLNMQQEGIFIRTRLAPKPGTDMAAILSSGKPLSAAQLGFIEKNSLISYATGGCAIPDRLKQQLVGFYTQMAVLSPLYKSTQTNDIVFGMGSPTMIEAAIDRVGAAAKESAETARIEAVLAPSGTPYTLGRISLSKLMGLILAAKPELAAAMKGAQATAVDEGIVFAAWPYKQERLTALLIPASDIKTLSSFAQAAQAQAMQKRQGGAAPARPPVPDNF